MISRATEWLNQWLWQEDLRETTRSRALGIGALRVLVHAGRSFSRNLVGIQAAGLTMITMLGLVPLLWLGFGVSRSLGLDDYLRKRVEELKTSSEMPTGFQDAITSFMSAVERVNYQTLGLVGTIILAYSGYVAFVTVERAFNHAWKTKTRSWYRRLGSFIAVVVLVPLFVIAAILVESVLQQGSLVKYMRENFGWLAALYDAGMRFLPVVVLWIAFTILYKLMPSTKVRWRPAATAGAFAAIVVFLLHKAYVQLQIGLALNNQVYAALAALPILIAYLSLMWTVILAGVQVSYAVQNINNLGPPARRNPRDASDPDPTPVA